MKKVLIITYYWPPSGGGGVQRWLKFTKYLPQFGWQPFVLTPSNPSVQEHDDSLLQELRKETTVYKIPIWEPYSIASKLFKVQTIPKQGIVSDLKDNKFSVLKWLRGNLLIPDARIFWKKAAVKNAWQIINDHQIDLAVTTGPPHSMHLIGQELKKKYGVKWVADFRDPWSDWDILDQMNMSSMARNRHQKLENRVLSNADGVVTVSKAWAEDFGNSCDRTVKVITNGFDPDDLVGIKPASHDKFRISHFGLINKFRNEASLWTALEELCKENQGFNKDLEIFLAGNVDEDISSKLLEGELARHIQLPGYLDHESLTKEYEKTTVFLLLTNHSKNEKGHIPGKLFEYLFAGRPIITFSPKNGDVAEIIIQNNAGEVLSRGDVEGMKNKLLELYQKFKSGETGNSRVDVAQFSRKVLTQRLADFLKSSLESD